MPGDKIRLKCEVQRQCARCASLIVTTTRCQPDHASSDDIRDEEIRGLLRRLAAEARHPGFASQVLVEAMVTQLSIELFRYGSAILERQQQRGLSSAQLRLIDERLREVRAAPSLIVLAELCGISVRTLTRSFSRSRGCTIGSYIANIQMEHVFIRRHSDRRSGRAADRLRQPGANGRPGETKRSIALVGRARMTVRSECSSGSECSLDRMAALDDIPRADFAILRSSWSAPAEPAASSPEVWMFHRLT